MAHEDRAMTADLGALFWPLLLLSLLLAAGLAVVIFWARRQNAAAAVDKDALVRERDFLARSLAAAPMASLELHAGDKMAPLLRPAGSLVGVLGLSSARETSLDGLTDRLAPDAAEALTKAILMLLAEGEAVDLLVTHADGERVFAVTSTSSENSHRLWFQEVTALQQRLEKVRAEAADHRRVLDSLPFLLWRRDANLELVDCNKAYSEALDVTRETVLSSGLELLGQSQIEQAKALSLEALSSDEPAKRESHVVVSGQRFLMELSERRLEDGSILGAAVDKTGEEELQAELKRHLDAQAEVLENLGTAIAIYGADMHLAFHNSAYVHIWRVDDDFFQGSPHLGDVLEALREQRHLPEQPNFPAYKRDTLRTYSTLIESREELLHLPDGRTLRMLVVPYPLGGVLLSYEDVTDRLAIERKYNTLIEVQQETLDKLHEGVAVYGADGILRLSNPAFAEIWRIPHEVLKSQPHVREIISYSRPFFEMGDEDWQNYTEHVVAETTDPTENSGRRERSDGTVIDWARVMLPDGAVLYTFVDVTDTLRVERVLRERNEALETADRLKSEFIASISYELRTPLNAIVGFGEILTNQFFGELNERQHEYAKAIVESSHELITLINDILDLASIEAGYLQIDRERVDVSELMDALYRLGRERAHNQDLTLELDCPSDIGTINADARRLKQALFNVLSNALKFTPEGGRISLKAERDGDYLDFTVSDTGIGISEEDQKRVFGRFERSINQGRQSGAGLGLALVQSLVELHDGTVSLTSKLDGGTEVICRIPAADAEARDVNPS
jgi:signal transduction histidine kinase